MTNVCYGVQVNNFDTGPSKNEKDDSKPKKSIKISTAIVIFAILIIVCVVAFSLYTNANTFITSLLCLVYIASVIKKFL